jgi:hypothetical protein
MIKKLRFAQPVDGFKALLGFYAYEPLPTALRSVASPLRKGTNHV